MPDLKLSNIHTAADSDHPQEDSWSESDDGFWDPSGPPSQSGLTQPAQVQFCVPTSQFHQGSIAPRESRMTINHLLSPKEQPMSSTLGFVPQTGAIPRSQVADQSGLDLSANAAAERAPVSPPPRAADNWPAAQALAADQVMHGQQFRSVQTREHFADEMPEAGPSRAAPEMPAGADKAAAMKFYKEKLET